MKLYYSIFLVFTLLVGTLQYNAYSQISSVRVTWDAPTAYTDGTILPDIAGYNIYWGTNGTRLYPNTVDVGNTTTVQIVLVDSPIEWRGTPFVITNQNKNIFASWTTPTSPTQIVYIACTALNTQNYESDYSDEIVYTQKISTVTNILLWGTVFPPTNKLICSETSGTLFDRSLFPNKRLYFSAGAIMSDGRYSKMPQTTPYSFDNRKIGKPINVRVVQSL
jgi:hypothetical protein